LAENVETLEFTRSKIIILHGPPGIGKTSNAINFAWKQNDEKGWRVQWFNAETREKILDDLRDTYELNEIHSNHEKSFEFLVKYLKHKLAKSPKEVSFLLILDNLKEEQDWIETLLVNFSENVHVLITSRDKNCLSHCESLNDMTLKLEVKYLNQKQSLHIFEIYTKSATRKYTQIDSFEKYFSDNQILPYDLNLLLTVLEKNKLWEVEDFLLGDEELADRIFKRLYEQSIANKSKKAWLCLEHMSLIDPDRIPVSLLIKFLDYEKNNKRIFQREVLNVLQTNSLVLEIIKSESDETFLGIHRRTQDMVKRILINHRDKGEVEKRVALMLIEEFPRVDKNAIDKWKLAKYLLNHMLKVYEENGFLNNKENDKSLLLEANEKLALYFDTVVGDFSQLIKYREREVEIKKEFYGSNLICKDMAASYVNLGNAYSQFNFLDKACEAYDETMRILNELNENGPELAAVYNNMGQTYAKMLNQKKALELYNKAIDTIDKFFPNQIHPVLAVIYNNIGQLHEKNGQLQYLNKALEFLNKSIQRGITSRKSSRLGWYLS
jgi:tetratricopeptide (TPR) repeat protein